MSNTKKDTRIKYVSIKDLLDNLLEYPYKSDMFPTIDKLNKKVSLLKGNTIPQEFNIYYKFTSQKLIYVYYGIKFTNYGQKAETTPKKIFIANRDGKTEYEEIKERLKELKESKNIDKVKRNEQIKLLEEIKQFIPKYQKSTAKEIAPKSFNLYLNDAKYKTSIKNLKHKYLVFDCETNGIGTSRDDLLSISIYDPTTGICYNRFFPLDLQPLILTSHINGITDKTLIHTTHMTQKEFNQLKNFFHLKERTLLSFSGGQGRFDYDFIQNYCKRHKIDGFSNLKFENIKDKIPRALNRYMCNLSKDSLCKLLKIEGVNQIHSSYNDCILEWKLYEELDQNCIFFHDGKVYKCNSKYIIPYTYLRENPQLIEYKNIKIPTIKGKANELYSISFPKKLLKSIKKFQSNITGVTLEHYINFYFNAEKQKNIDFFNKNLQYRQCILSNQNKDIIYKEQPDGTIKAKYSNDDDVVKQINSTTKSIIEQSKPVLDYCKSKIFKGNNIISQELVLSNDKKVFTLCDLSDSENVLEIKTCEIMDSKNTLKDSIAKQLYFQSKGRKTYILSFKFDINKNDKLTGLTVSLYKVKLSIK